jgi:nucleoside-diphosphate-sugar epimerase
MRFDLVVNTMFKTALTERKVVVRNPSIWRPILDIRDAATAYLRTVQADYSLSGVYNIASGNYTVGQVGDMVKSEVEKLTGEKVSIEINNVEDFRNYKVSIERAITYLGFRPQNTVTDIIEHLYEHRDDFGDYNEDRLYNIRIFEKLKI